MMYEFDYGWRDKFRIAGEQIFGYWLPYVGFKTMECYEDGSPALNWYDEWDNLHEVPKEQKPIKRTFLIAEWFAVMIVFSLGRGKPNR